MTKQICGKPRNSDGQPCQRPPGCTLRHNWRPATLTGTTPRNAAAVSYGSSGASQTTRTSDAHSLLHADDDITLAGSPEEMIERLTERADQITDPHIDTEDYAEDEYAVQYYEDNPTNFRGAHKQPACSFSPFDAQEALLDATATELERFVDTDMDQDDMDTTFWRVSAYGSALGRLRGAYPEHAIEEATSFAGRHVSHLRRVPSALRESGFEGPWWERDMRSSADYASERSYDLEQRPAASV